ncbi:hypothetical protein ALP06_200249 [Pseudomonas coronafaciens pv. atropurpurea]|nr:hypothetical protein ALP06_200249 [Pseudomonas coronafaciens pv. atropurpurea]
MPIPTVLVPIGHVDAAVVFRGAVEIVSHNEFVVLSIGLEDHQMRRQVAEIELNAVVLGRLPLLERIDVNLTQLSPRARGVTPEAV